MKRDTQAELSALQQSEGEWRAEKAALNDQLNKTKEELVSLRASSGGSVAKLEEVSRSLKDERSRTKQLELQLEAVNDEFKEAKAAHELAVQKADALKKKMEKERERLEAEHEETKTRFEADIEELRRKVDMLLGADLLDC